jgi:hypothetical protein
MTLDCRNYNGACILNFHIWINHIPGFSFLTTAGPFGGMYKDHSQG